MARQFIDKNLVLWQVYPSTGRFGLPEGGRLIFLCISDRERAPRSVPFDGDMLAAEAAMMELTDEELRDLLERAREMREAAV